jgi:hypothetical protein
MSVGPVDMLYWAFWTSEGTATNLGWGGFKKYSKKNQQDLYNRRKHSGMGLPESIPPRNVFRPVGQYTILSCGNWFYEGPIPERNGISPSWNYITIETVRTKIWLHLSDRIVEFF